MTLIETLIYIALLSIILVGSVFSAYSIMFSQERTQQAVETFVIN